MEENFNMEMPNGERPDLQICIFPHLKEFLVLDLRETPPQLELLTTEEVFTKEFNRCLEAEFAHLLHENEEHPFANLINLPIRMEEVSREVTMTFILERLGIHAHDADSLPTVMVFILSGGALALHSAKVIEGLRDALKNTTADPVLGRWEAILNRLIAEENAALQSIEQDDLAEALQGDAPDYFSLWESRN